LAINTRHKGFGNTTDESRGEKCKIGCIIDDIGIIECNKLCGCANQFLCWYSVGSFPWGDKEFLPDPVCGCFFWQCAPECGCCARPPPCPALDKVRHENGTPGVIANVMNDREAALAAGHAVASLRDLPTGATKVEQTILADGSTVTKKFFKNADGSVSVTESTARP
jgi:hypothetical protein